MKYSRVPWYKPSEYWATLHPKHYKVTRADLRSSHRRTNCDRIVAIHSHIGLRRERGTLGSPYKAGAHSFWAARHHAVEDL